MDHKREDRNPPLARGMGVGRQQQHSCVHKREVSTLCPATKLFILSIFNEEVYHLDIKSIEMNSIRIENAFSLIIFILIYLSHFSAVCIY